jgi:GxxExxY protein
LSGPGTAEAKNSTWDIESTCWWNLVIVEIKCVEAIHPVHEAQLLSYLRLSGKNVGLLINFHVARLKDGIKRMVDGRDWEK